MHIKYVCEMQNSTEKYKYQIVIRFSKCELLKIKDTCKDEWLFAQTRII
jgi:hypothetical protein